MDGYADIRTLEAALDAVDTDARKLIDGLTADQGIWRPSPGAWSIAHCLDHLATANRVYLDAMEPAAADAAARGRRHSQTPRRNSLQARIGCGRFSANTGYRSYRRALSEPVHFWRAIQPRDGTARYRGARPTACLAGVNVRKAVG